MGDSSPISARSSVLFGIHSQSKAQQDLQRIRRQNKRFTFIAAGAIFVLVVAMICLVVLDLYTSASIIKRQNRTQTLTEQRIEHLGELIKTQQWKLVQDVNLKPEEAQDRWDTVGTDVNDGLETENTQLKSYKANLKSNGTIEYANHRYSDEPDYGKPEQRIGWKPRPFSLKIDAVETERPVNSIQDILGHTVEPPQRPLPPPGYSKPMRFRGVFLHPPSEKLPLQQEDQYGDRRGEYHKKINEFFTSHKRMNNLISDAGNTAMEGSNIHETYVMPELYTKAIYHPHHKQDPPIELRKNWNRRTKKPKRKPFTVMLDIYPMDKTEEIGVVPLVASGKKPKSAIFVPVRPGEALYEPVPAPVQYLPQFTTPPKQRKKERMLMKLNLYPKSAQRRTFSLFKKESSQESCTPKVIMHNPFGKPVRAKWRGKNGDIINAKFVSLSRWEDRRGDTTIDPR